MRKRRISDDNRIAATKQKLRMVVENMRKENDILKTAKSQQFKGILHIVQKAFLFYFKMTS